MDSAIVVVPLKQEHRICLDLYPLPFEVKVTQIDYYRRHVIHNEQCSMSEPLFLLSRFPLPFTEVEVAYCW
jgi:hypothetical protein